MRVDRLGDLDRAESHYRRLVAARHEHGQDGSVEALNSCNNLAHVLLRRGKVDEAEQIWRDALPRAEETLPATHFLLAIFHKGIGECRVAAGDCAAGAAELEQALWILEQAEGDQRIRIQKTLLPLIEAREALGETEAATLLRQRRRASPVAVEVLGQGVIGPPPGRPLRAVRATA